MFSLKSIIKATPANFSGPARLLPKPQNVNSFHTTSIKLDSLPFPKINDSQSPKGKKPISRTNSVLETITGGSQAKQFQVLINYNDYKYSGRSVFVKDDPMRAYYRLNGILKGNQVRKELVRHRYYEKPCLKRRRLAMESNRRRFKEAVSHKVGLVMQLKNRGA